MVKIILKIIWVTIHNPLTLILAGVIITWIAFTPLQSLGIILLVYGASFPIPKKESLKENMDKNPLIKN